MPYSLSEYDPDPLRFYLTATAPEPRDTEPAHLNNSDEKILDSTPHFLRKNSSTFSMRPG
jgi:hypothetical protein